MDVLQKEPLKDFDTFSQAFRRRFADLGNREIEMDRSRQGDSRDFGT